MKPFGLKIWVILSPKGFILLAVGFSPALFRYVIKFSFLRKDEALNKETCTGPPPTAALLNEKTCPGARSHQ